MNADKARLESEITTLLFDMLQQLMHRPDRHVLIDDVHGLYDEHGQLQPQVTLTLRTGHTVRVQVAAE